SIGRILFRLFDLVQRWIVEARENRKDEQSSSPALEHPDRMSLYIHPRLHHHLHLSRGSGRTGKAPASSSSRASQGRVVRRVGDIFSRAPPTARKDQFGRVHIRRDRSRVRHGGGRNHAAPSQV